MRLHRRRLAPLVALLALAACFSPGLPPAEPASEVAAQAMAQTRVLYLKPELLDRRVIIGAFEALEARFDPVRFEANGAHGVLYVGDERADVPLDDALDPERFRALLGRAIAFVQPRLDPEDLQDLARDGSSLELVAVNGALQSLDPYSTVFSARRGEDFKIRFSGKLYGIGARIGRRDGSLTAMRVFPDSPAQRGGLADGDAIVGIDGEPTQPLSVSEAVEKIRGAAGSQVVLSVKRQDASLQVSITRGEVTIPSVDAKLLEPGVGYAQILEESRATPGEFLAKVQELGKLDGLVLDLRGNSGGSMLAAAALADFFLDQGTIVRVVGRDDGAGMGVRDRSLANPAVEFPFPVAVLVDNGTASAAEILSGALSELPRVTLIGQTTYGKGLVQRVIPLAQDNLLKLTVAEYLLAQDRAIHLKGIEPDLMLFPVPDEQLGRVVAAPATSIPYLRTKGADDQFPVELATAVVKQGRTSAARELRARATTGLREKLAAAQVEWTEANGLPEPLPRALTIEGEALDVVPGKPSRLRVRVSNPNDFAVPHAWLALDSPITFLAGRLAPLGTLEAGATQSAEIEVTAPDGLSLAEIPMFAHVASGARALASHRLVVRAPVNAPVLGIDVVRRDAENVTVEVENRGAAPTGEVRVILQTSSRAIESLAPGQRKSVELPIAGDGNQVVVALVGSGAQRAYEIPLPAERTHVEPPSVSFARTPNGIGGSAVVLSAESAHGLRLGWLRLDEHKREFSRWDGAATGALQAPLEGDGYVTVQSKIEDADGVAVLDTRLLIAD